MTAPVTELRLVILESPYSGDVAANKAYLQECIRDCVQRGESPYASHQMLTDALDDLDPEQRKAGIAAGFAWRGVAAITVFYLDHGWSRGMLLGLEDCKAKGLPHELRRIT